jgi:hypothetical protein
LLYVCSIKQVPEFIRENGGTLAMSVTVADTESECIATDIGMMIVQRSAAEVFRAHGKDFTWNGNFEITDFVVVNDDEIRMTKIPVPGEPAQKANDWHRIGSLLMPLFIHRGRMALYFHVLTEDLKTASESDVSEDWFREYVLGHAALRPSSVRYDLIDGLHQAAREFDFEGSTIKTFVEAIPSPYVDWRRHIPTDASDIFRKIYMFRFEATEGNPAPFERTNGGLLSFKRHFCRHASKHIKKLQDLTEVEIIGARKFENALPHILKMLLRDCEMHKGGP